MLRIDTQFIQNLEQLSSQNSTLSNTLEKYKSYKAKIQEFKKHLDTIENIKKWEARQIDYFGDLILSYADQEFKNIFSLNESYFLLSLFISQNFDYELYESPHYFLVDKILKEVDQKFSNSCERSKQL